MYTGNPVRDLGYFRWHDPLSWLEHMRGEKWDAAVKRENVHFRRAIEELASEKEVDALEARFHKIAEAHMSYDIFHSGSIDITPQGTYSYFWKWRGEGQKQRAAAVVSEGDLAWAIEEDSRGAEQYKVSCYKKGSQKPIWTYGKFVGPSLCVKDGLCYLVESTDLLRYGHAVALDAKTGVFKKRLFTEPSPRHTLRLEMGEHRCIFLISANSGREALYHIEGLRIQRIGHEGVCFVPVGYASADSEIPCFFARVRSLDEPWTAFGKELQILTIPKNLRLSKLSILLKHKLLLVSAGGVSRVYKLRSGLNPELLEEGIGSWSVDWWSCWSGADKISLLKITPGSTPSVYSVGKKGFLCLKKGDVYASVSLQNCQSKDGTSVPYIVVKRSGKPRGLMVSMYGAYNIPTNLSTSRWAYWIENGWTIVFGLVRGGGDFGDAWAEAARRDRKVRSIEDAEAVVRSAQRETGVSANATCIHGVSAGGYILGALVARHSQGNLFGAAYAIVPYLDVLRTTTNPTLPLTVLEYDEFGNPAEKLEDLAAIVKLSPVDTLPEEGAPSLFVVARTSMFDVEVLPYESVKWMYRLRGWPKKKEGEEKYLAITAGAGHFVRNLKGASQNAEDFLLLNGWLLRHSG